MTETNDNPFAVAATQQGISIAQTRAAQEIQAQLVVAKKFPRNEEQAIERIRRSCQRRSLAEQAQYAYPRGGTVVTGPSIRLAECIAQQWGNMDFGVVELEQRNGESTMLAYAYDLETNTRSAKTFQVRHERKAHKEIVIVEDPRDIYELTANQGARRLRACILSIIPGDVVELALEQCDLTLKTNKEPLIDRVRKMSVAFNQFGITVAMLEKRLGHKLDATIETELVMLRKIYTSVRDGMSKREDWFTVGEEIKRPQFEQPASHKEEDENAESAAGLAPAASAPPKATAQAAPLKRPRGRPPAARPVVETTFTEPTPAPKQATPVRAAAPPVQAETQAAEAEFDYDSPSPINQVYQLMVKDAIQEAEIMAILKRRGLCQPETPTLADCPEQTIKDLIQNWSIASAQARIDRKARG